jgi:DHA1 family tetracycline resistance protein-like MFS transporter
MKNMNKIALWTLYLIYGLDMAGIGIVFVVFAPLLIDPTNSMLPSDFSVGARNVLLGILFAAYPLTQFFAAPLLGELSDRIGRKKPLLFACLATGASFAFSAFAIYVNSYLLLLFSRLCSGFTSGNMTIAQAAVSDGVEKEKIPSAMAMFNTISGIGWIVAPFGGSLLTDRHLASWFSFETPFLVMAIFFFVLAFLLMKYFEESHRCEERTVSMKAVIKDYKEVYFDPKLRTALLMAFTSIFAWLLYQGFMSTYLDERYNFSENQIGRTFAYFSFFWFLGGFIASNWLLKKFSAKKLIIVPLIIVPFTIVAYLFFKTSDYMWLFSAIANVSESLIISCFFAIFASEAREDQQGKVFGFWNASQAFSFFITPIIAGTLSIIHINAPFLLATLLGIFIIFWFFRCRKLQFSNS